MGDHCERDDAGLDESPFEAPEDVARLAADVLVVEKMRDIGYDVEHRMGQGLVKQLRQVGAGTLIKLWRSNDLFPRAARLHVGLPTPPPATWSSEAPSLLSAAAAEAAPRFVATNLSTWSPEGGASIVTYYVNYTIMNDLKTMYHAYYRSERARRDHEVAYDDEKIEQHAQCELGDGGLAKAVDRTLIEQARRQMGPRTKEIYDGIGEGLPRNEIAKNLGVHPRTITRDIQRFQQELRNKHGWVMEDGAR